MNYSSYKTKIGASGTELLNRAREKLKSTIDTIKKDTPIHSKIGLGLGFTSLGLGVANFHNNSVNSAANNKRLELERKSVSALEKIHSVLKHEQKPFDNQ